MTLQEAKLVMGENFVGASELAALPWLRDERLNATEPSFPKEKLESAKKTHILIFAPQVPMITINWFREKFGVDPAASEPCMYNQDWYLKESFASEETLDGQWHLIRKEVLEEVRAKRPDEIESALKGEQFPTAVTLTFLFFVWHALKGEALWKHDFLWSSDRDHNGDRIYVGRYEDPTGVNKNGFNVHRHLALRPSYSVAPEIL